MLALESLLSAHVRSGLSSPCNLSLMTEHCCHCQHTKFCSALLSTLTGFLITLLYLVCVHLLAPLSKPLDTHTSIMFWQIQHIFQCNIFILNQFLFTCKMWLESCAETSVFVRVHVLNKKNILNLWYTRIIKCQGFVKGEEHCFRSWDLYFSKKYSK